MIDLVSAVGLLRKEGQAVHLGTAWLLSNTHALTATHCLEERGPTSGLFAETPSLRQLAPGPFSVTFRQRQIGVQVERHDFGLDVALLRLTEAVPWDLPPLDILPRPEQFPSGQLGWQGYGYPVAHPTGLGLSGTITIVNGNVKGHPAIQLACDQGGRGELEGISGGPVAVADRIVGLIRFGPPKLHHLVVHATSLADVATTFPEVRQRMEDSGNWLADSTRQSRGAKPASTRVQLYVALTMLTPVLFNELLFFLNAPAALLAPKTTPQATQAMSLITYYESQNGEGLLPIIQLMDEEHSALMKKVRERS